MSPGKRIPSDKSPGIPRFGRWGKWQLWRKVMCSLGQSCLYVQGWLVAAGVIPFPFEYVDALTTMTHKSLERLSEKDIGGWKQMFKMIDADNNGTIKVI
ncbi:carboxymethylenebutenolidase, partial [Tanacetum coccineum]